MTIILHNLLAFCLLLYWRYWRDARYILLMKVKDPMHHPKVNQAEIDYIRAVVVASPLGCKRSRRK